MRSRIGSLLVATALFAGCGAYNTEPKSLLLPTSNRKIDLVQHRSDVRLTDCGTLTVLQTYDNFGKLIDSKEAKGSALHCVVIPALIEAGGDVGAGFVGRAVNVLSNAQSQGQKQGQAQGQYQGQGQSTTNTAVGGAGGSGGAGGNGGGGEGRGHGNNGRGNGDGDGTNPGTDNHHDNGDNS
jgi:hypothetical protein